MASSRRSAFSLRLRYFRTPAASSMIEPALLGPGVEHGVDLALADDHVLLAADAGVGQQLLDVEQPARHAVDGVLAVAGAEQRAGDRDLGELDRQQPGGVVDGEATSARPSAGRLAVPAKMTSSIFWERTALGRLGAEHPGDGVDDVGLAAPLGPTTTVTPGSSSSVVVSAKDLKPLRVSVLRNMPSADASRCQRPRHRADRATGGSDLAAPGSSR